MKHSAEIKAAMAAQLARVREMERNGELEPIPEISVTTLSLSPWEGRRGASLAD